MSCIVAIETSTEHCSVALSLGGKLSTLRQAGVRQHAELVLPMLAKLLAEYGLARSSIDVIGYGRGPGAFTGVRLAVAVAQGLGFALDRPTFGVSSLQACASAAHIDAPNLVASAQAGESAGGAPQLVVLLDARMGECYVAAYQCDKTGAPFLLGEECLLTPAAFSGWLAARDIAPKLFVGNGLAALPADFLIAHPLALYLPEIRPDAEAIAKLTEIGFAAKLAVPARLAQPAYVRDKVADTIIERAQKRAAQVLSAAPI